MSSRDGRPLLLIVCLAAAAVPAVAKTSDGQTPAEETVCDNETEAFGLCNAYCEAMDCDSPNHHASDQACASVRRNFERQTGRPIPCAVPCPCFDVLDLFGQLRDGSADALRCTIASEFVIVETVAGQFAVVDTGPPAQCSVDMGPPFVDLTETELLVCRVGLRQAAEAQGVPCLPPN